MSANANELRSQYVVANSRDAKSKNNQKWDELVKKLESLEFHVMIGENVLQMRRTRLLSRNQRKYDFKKNRYSIFIQIAPNQTTDDSPILRQLEETFPGVKKFFYSATHDWGNLPLGLIFQYPMRAKNNDLIFIIFGLCFKQDTESDRHDFVVDIEALQQCFKSALISCEATQTDLYFMKFRGSRKTDFWPKSRLAISNAIVEYKKQCTEKGDDCTVQSVLVCPKKKLNHILN